MYLMTQRRQWQPRQGMNPNAAFNRWNNHSPFQTNYPPMNQMQYPPYNPMQTRKISEELLQNSNTLTLTERNG